ncbi:MAG TPA: sodium-dependent transporter, partial [Ruminococcus sp.]|nr:sodium-dependent transporter [Ruminococcus sp.]
PLLLTEMSIGRHTKSNSIDACKKISPKWGIAGGFGVAGAFVILSYYMVIGGWVLKYMTSYLFGTIENPQQYFSDFTSSTAEPIIWLVVFTGICALIVNAGVSNGIEKISKIFLPLLFLFIIIIAVKSLSLPNSIEGVKFFLIPDFSQKNWISIFINAMGQVFFSLSLGMGTLITYGSYLDDDVNLVKNSLYIPIFDAVIAITAGFAVLPAVFAFNIPPESGAGMIFQVLPSVFNEIKFGRIFAVIFFLLVFFAAVTSAISLFEVITAYLSENRHFKRLTAVIMIFIATSFTGILSSMSFGKLSNIKILGMTFFEFFSFLSDKILMPLGGLLICILAGYIWDRVVFKNELSSGGKYKVKIFKSLRFILRYTAPLMIIIILISSWIMDLSD